MPDDSLRCKPIPPKHSMNYTKAVHLRIKLYVRDFDQRREFYESRLRWPVFKEWGDRGDRGVMYDTGAGIIELLECASADSHDGNSDVSIEVVDVEVVWAEFEGCASVVFPLRHNSWGDRSFCVRDPGGFHLTFFTKDV